MWYLVVANELDVGLLSALVLIGAGWGTYAVGAGVCTITLGDHDVAVAVGLLAAVASLFSEPILGLGQDARAELHVADVYSCMPGDGGL